MEFVHQTVAKNMVCPISKPDLVVLIAERNLQIRKVDVGFRMPAFRKFISRFLSQNRRILDRE